MPSPQVPTEALLGYGCLVELEDTSVSPAVWTELMEVKNITPPSRTPDTVEVTHMQSPNRSREYIAGLVDSGECSFEMNWVPGSATDDLIMAILSLGVGVSRTRNFRITYPNGAIHSFAGEISGYEVSAPTDDVMTATLTVKVSGDVVLS